jgi:hypothetical protein
MEEWNFPGTYLWSEGMAELAKLKEDLESTGFFS